MFDLVKEQILTGELPGGELISEGEIAERCQVSRTPVREAFLRLSVEGWMKLYPKRGALVVPIGEREAREVIDARLLVEGHAVRCLRSADRREALIARLRDNVRRQREAGVGDLAEFARIDAEFHREIVAEGGNGLLSTFFRSLGERHRRMTSASVQRDRAIADRVCDDHELLIDAISSGDPDRFSAELRAHLARVHQLPGEAL